MANETLTINQLTAMSDEDTIFEAAHIQTMILRNSNNISKWLGILSIEGVKQRTLLLELNHYYSGRYKHFRWDSEYECARAEIPIMINGDPEYIRRKKVLEISKQKLDLIEGTLKSLSGLGFNIRNFIEWEKIKSGL